MTPVKAVVFPPAGTPSFEGSIMASLPLPVIAVDRSDNIT